MVSELRKIGFIGGTTDPCLLTRKNKDGLCMVVICVDVCVLTLLNSAFPGHGLDMSYLICVEGLKDSLRRLMAGMECVCSVLKECPVEPASS